MKLFALSVAAALAVAAGAVVPINAQPLDHTAIQVAAKRNPHQAAPRHQHAAPRGGQRNETGQIACTFAGCFRIPANCHPATDYYWNGIPTGYDAVACPDGRRYSRQ